MRTNIDVPEELMRRADRASAERNITSSALFVLAMEFYLDARATLGESSEAITRTWDAVADEPGPALDPALRHHQHGIVARSDW
jgi:hypothetical protein